METIRFHVEEAVAAVRYSDTSVERAVANLARAAIELANRLEALEARMAHHTKVGGGA